MRCLVENGHFRPTEWATDHNCRRFLNDCMRQRAVRILKCARIAPQGRWHAFVLESVRVRFSIIRETRKGDIHDKKAYRSTRNLIQTPAVGTRAGSVRLLGGHPGSSSHGGVAHGECCSAKQHQFRQYQTYRADLDPVERQSGFDKGQADFESSLDRESFPKERCSCRRTRYPGCPFKP